MSCSAPSLLGNMADTNAKRMEFRSPLQGPIRDPLCTVLSFTVAFLNVT